ncbi:MAG: right-handed parallel beta-helix repeat-containing protein, partial [Chitinophagaceae bacterium]|nr:right-handed parallel beta-helix repeat-containing protein [Chitinophagaceae bacterium]
MILSGNSYCRTIITGNGEAVTSIGKAITIAADYDTIVLKKGVYKEGSLVITKPLTLIGENGAVLDGENKYEILTISARNVTIRNINFRNAGYSALNDFAAIKLVNASFVQITGNSITNAYFAIHISNSAYCTVRENSIVGSPKSEQLTGNGIHLWKCSHALIYNNHI